MLTKRWVGTGVVALAIGFGSFAALSAQGARPNAVDKADGKRRTMTLTGCLQGPVPTDEYALSLGPEIAQDAADAVATYRLTDVTSKTQPASSAMYLVVGSDKQLSPQLGHQVQIVGTIVDREARGTTGERRADTTADATADQYTGSSAAKTGSSAGNKAAIARTTEPTVRVESVRMVSAKCSTRR